MELEGLVNEYNRSVAFIWLPSHIGIKGNESADRLANLSTANCTIDIGIGPEMSEACSLVDNYIINRWQKIWDNGNTGSQYRSTVQSVSTRVKYLHMSRHQEVVITRLRLGKCQLNAYLHQIGKHADGLCVTCGRPETVSHFLTECQNNVVCSAVLAACSKFNLNPTLDIMLSDSRLLNVIISSVDRKI